MKCLRVYLRRSGMRRSRKLIVMPPYPKGIEVGALIADEDDSQVLWTVIKIEPTEALVVGKLYEPAAGTAVTAAAATPKEATNV